MTNTTHEITLGIDVAKDELVIGCWATGELNVIPNQRRAIRDWLTSLSDPVALALEPTSIYHLLIADEAVARGYSVYLVNTRALVHYREATEGRSKTDMTDALLLSRYLTHERHSLRPYMPQCPKVQALWGLLKRRAAVVKARKQLEQSFKSTGLSVRSVYRELDQLLKRIDHRMQGLIETLGWSDDYQRCQSIPGIGPLNAMAMVITYHRGNFSGSDAFIAYIGMDIRRKESGTYKGKSRLSKRGASEIRRLLFCAAKPARCYKRFADYHQKQLDKGLSKIAANCILGRKLARIAFALMERQEVFQR